MENTNRLATVTGVTTAIATISQSAIAAPAMTASDFAGSGLGPADMITVATTVVLPVFGVFFLLGLAFKWFRRSRS